MSREVRDHLAALWRAPKLHPDELHFLMGYGTCDLNEVECIKTPPNVVKLVEQPCPRCLGYGEVASECVDEDGDELPPRLCPRCGGTGRWCPVRR